MEIDIILKRIALLLSSPITGARLATKYVRITLNTCGLALDSSSRALKALAGVHKGKRAVIIGNGPSLRIQDLDRLTGEVTFASNKIYLAFDNTTWRPTYYCVFDALVAKNNADTIVNLPLKKIISRAVQSLFPATSKAIWVDERCSQGAWTDPEKAVEATTSGRYFSTDSCFGVYGGWTVIYAQLQLAFHMGIREAVLIGVDFSFSTTSKQVSTNLPGSYAVALESCGEQNHFHPNYRPIGEIWAQPDLAAQRKAFACAKWVFEKHGGRILNASRSTKLDVFERASFDDLFPPVNVSVKALGIVSNG